MWKLKARNVITSILLEYEAECLCLGKPFELETAFKKVSEGYPFGLRQHHPYKAWLATVKQAKGLLNRGLSIRDLTFADWESVSIQKDKPVKGQLTIFEV